MKSKLIILVMIITLLSACSNTNQRDEILLNKYESAYEKLANHDNFEILSDYYQIELVVSEVESGSHRIDLILDEPQVAMYNIEMMMEVNPTGSQQYDEVLSSLGIVDDLTYNLIPNQVNADNGFYEGLVLSSVSDQVKGEVKVLITWTNYSSTQNFEEFIVLSYDNDLKDPQATEDNSEVDDNDE